MPTITVDHGDLCRLLGAAIGLDRVLDDLARLKCEVESLEGTRITIEVTSDRPDLFSAAGIAAALKGLEGLEVGPPPIEVERGGVKARVERSVLPVRPFIALSEVRGLQMSDEAVRQVMQLQEKLHETYCRHRRKVSIGVHDRDAIAPPLRYEALEPTEIAFVPLGERRRMRGDEILRLTPKGIRYGPIIDRFDRYPLLVDGKGMVLSMPPIINSIHTVVTPDTRNVLVDVTGTDRELVKNVLNIVTFALAQRGGTVRTVEVEGPDGATWTPDLTPVEKELSVDYVNEVLGLRLSAEKVRGYLLRMRLGASVIGRRRLRVLVPPYRTDILHQIDLVEDVLMAHGYDRVRPEIPPMATIGREGRMASLTRRIRDLMIGLGFQEVLNYMMTNKGVLFTKMRLRQEAIVEVANPVSATYSALRSWLLPCLLEFLQANRHVPYPQKIFECGDVVVVDGRTETKTRSARRLAAVIADSKAGYEDIQAVLHSLLSSLGVRGWSIEPAKHRSFIGGRCAAVLKGRRRLAILGEVHPEVIMNFKLEMPVAGLEVDVNRILRLREGG